MTAQIPRVPYRRSFRHAGCVAYLAVAGVVFVNLLWGAEIFVQLVLGVILFGSVVPVWFALVLIAKRMHPEANPGGDQGKRGGALVALDGPPGPGTPAGSPKPKQPPATTAPAEKPAFVTARYQAIVLGKIRVEDLQVDTSTLELLEVGGLKTGLETVAGKITKGRLRCRRCRWPLDPAKYAGPGEPGGDQIPRLYNCPQCGYLNWVNPGEA